jgi:periplasmic protein TonB
MNTVSIYEKNWLDLVFEGKNQEYGAYQLRQQSPRTTLLAFFYGVLLLSGFIGVFMLSSFLSKPETSPLESIIDKPIVVCNYPIVKPEPKKPETQQQKQQQQKEPTNLSNMVVASKDDAEEDIPTNKEIENTTPSTEGTIGGTGIIPTVNTGGTEVIETKGTTDPVPTIELDRLPEFPGGINRFYDYVGKNFERPELEEGTIITVFVSFVVEKDGSMTDIKVLRNPGYGLDIEAIRVLKSLKTKWTPGIKDKEKMRTLYFLPIKVKS